MIFWGKILSYKKWHAGTCDQSDATWQLPALPGVKWQKSRCLKQSRFKPAI